MMEYIVGTQDFKFNNSIVTIGKFDSLHRGHQFLLKTAEHLKKDGMKIIIFTFDTSPLDVLTNKTNKRILTKKERRDLANSFGTDVLIEYPFNENVMNMLPDEFVQKVLVNKLGIRELVCGDDFHFGKNREGTPELLLQLGSQYGFNVHVEKKVRYDGQEISSSLIKNQLSLGNIKVANDMLGWTYSLEGRIVSGKQIGRKIGYPTANLEISDNYLLLPNGVYATKVEYNGKRYTAVTNVGTNPTFGDNNSVSVESHIPGFDGNLYGKTIRVSFYDFIRPERAFESEKMLADQIKKDIAGVIGNYGDN